MGLSFRGLTHLESLILQSLASKRTFKLLMRLMRIGVRVHNAQPCSPEAGLLWHRFA
jgi:hypothetical protein